MPYICALSLCHRISVVRGVEQWQCGDLGAPTTSLCIFERTWGLGLLPFNSEGDNIFPYKLANQQTKWVKLKVWRELPKINLLDLLANENHCNFSMEDNTVVVFWLKMTEQLWLIGPGEKKKWFVFPRQGSYRLREIMINLYIFPLFFFAMERRHISNPYTLLLFNNHFLISRWEVRDVLTEGR